MGRRRQHAHINSAHHIHTDDDAAAGQERTTDLEDDLLYGLLRHLKDMRDAIINNPLERRRRYASAQLLHLAARSGRVCDD